MLRLQMFARTYINIRPSHKQVCSFFSTKCYVRKTSSMSTFNSLKIDEMRSRASSIRPDRAQYRLIEFVENLDRYCPGGYHPLQIGDDIYDRRYRLVDKLGYGGYWSIWLARDLRLVRYVAVKAITTDTSACTPGASLINSLGYSPSRPGREIIPP